MDAWKELDADGRETFWANWMHMACMDAGIGLETLGLDWTRMGLDWIGLASIDDTKAQQTWKHEAAARQVYIVGGSNERV